MVEAAIRDPHVDGPQLAYVGHLQQLVYARLRDYPDWRDAVLAGLPADCPRTQLLDDVRTFWTRQTMLPLVG